MSEYERNIFNCFCCEQLIYLKEIIELDIKQYSDENLKNLLMECNECIDFYIEENNFWNIELQKITANSFLGRIDNLSYSNLKQLIYIFKLASKYVHDEFFMTIYKYALKMMNKKLSYLKFKSDHLEDMTLKDYEILLDCLNGYYLKLYAYECDVNVDELTPKIMYKRYHVDLESGV